MDHCPQARARGSGAIEKGSILSGSSAVRIEDLVSTFFQAAGLEMVTYKLYRDA